MECSARELSFNLKSKGSHQRCVNGRTFCETGYFKKINSQEYAILLLANQAQLYKIILNSYSNERDYSTKRQKN